ncbi:MAG: hypothetical protein AB7H93_06265 [Vicinamibacterales bacterium]
MAARITRRLGLVILSALVAGVSLPLSAQGVLSQLGLTEARAREFVLAEVKSPSAPSRRSPVAVAGHRAFYKLPRAARGPAATALFAWAKGYVQSAAFTAAYAEYRQGVIGTTEPAAAPSVEARLTAQLDEMRAAAEQAKQIAAALPPAEREALLAQIEAQAAQVASPQFQAQLRAGLEQESADRAQSETDRLSRDTERYPVDPTPIIAGHLHAFLDATADADFTARTINLTGGPDGIEFVEPAHQDKSWMWQLAVLAGPEATAAARTAAAAWLAEIAR